MTSCCSQCWALNLIVRQMPSTEPYPASLESRSSEIVSWLWFSTSVRTSVAWLAFFRGRDHSNLLLFDVSLVWYNYYGLKNSFWSSVCSDWVPPVWVLQPTPYPLDTSWVSATRYSLSLHFLCNSLEATPFSKEPRFSIGRYSRCVTSMHSHVKLWRIK